MIAKRWPLFLSAAAAALFGCGGKTGLWLYDDADLTAGSGGLSGGDSGAGGHNAGGTTTGGFGGAIAGTGGFGSSLIAGSAGVAGVSGSGGAPPTACLTAEVGHAFYSASAPDLAYVMLQSFIDGEYNILEIDLRPPSAGAFDLSKLENQNTGTCTECVTVKRFQNGVWDRIFLPESGALTVETISHVDGYSSGQLTDVVFREVVIDEATGSSTPVENGQCLTIAEAWWRTAQCSVGSECPADMECLGTYYSTNGSCVPRGARASGDVCSAELPTTDCQAGFDCAYGFCRPTCSFWTMGPTCPPELLCNPDSRCINGADSAPIGSACTLGLLAYCGPENGRFAGQCVDQNGQAMCGRVCRDHADCATSCVPLYENATYGTCAP